MACNSRTLSSISYATGLSYCQVGGCPFLFLFSFSFLTNLCCCFPPAILPNQPGLSTPIVVDLTRLSPQIRSFLSSNPCYPSIFTSFIHRRNSNLSFHSLCSHLLGYVFHQFYLNSSVQSLLTTIFCRPLERCVQYPRRLDCSHHHHRLSALVGSFARGNPTAYLASFNWWLRSERCSLLDDGVFLPSISSVVWLDF